MKFNEIIGQKFSKLTVLECLRNEKNRIAYKCQCECGGIRIVVRGNLLEQKTRNCGCVKKLKSLKNRREVYQQKLKNLAKL